MFCAGPNLTAFSASSKTFVPAQKPILLKAHMPCPFTGPKMYCASPNFLSQTKNLFTYCGSHKHFVPEKKIICIE